MKRQKPEILAPAGSVAAFKAAVYAGADAVYLAGNRFGARAYADNFGTKELIWAIEYAHIYGVKVYLTINTLFRDEEINELYEYLSPLYEAGLDAVIVQDLGVMSYVHSVFPDLPIHASTQMTITTEYAFTLLKHYGVTRVVPARELSIEEIASVKNSFPEVEVFVQGALCYCYSGQCLMSSMLGGRSGNRGRCAQTCRLPYDVVDDSNKKLSTNGKYILSPKDLCGLEAIPDLIGAGVDSFKIEGRMKKPEYVAVCVNAYRKCVDAYFEGKLTKQLIESHKMQMAEVFNRGGFTSGYYKKHNGFNMMSIKNPGNVGVSIGEITAINKNKITIRLQEKVLVGDILVISIEEENVTLTCNTEGNAGLEIVLNAPSAKRLCKGQRVRRMQHAGIMKEYSAYSEAERKLSVSGVLIMSIDKPAVFCINTTINGKAYSACIEGDMVQRASVNPLDEQTILSKITATGNTRYVFEKLDVQMDDNVYYPLKGLKELRRNGLQQLEEEIVGEFRRKKEALENLDLMSLEHSEIKENSEGDVGCKWNGLNMTPDKTLLQISSLAQHEEILSFIDEGLEEEIELYLDLQYFEIEAIMELVSKHQHIKYCLVLPPVLRTQNITEVKQVLEMISVGTLLVHGIVVKNIDELALVKEMKIDIPIVTDYSLYAMNTWSVKWLEEQCDSLTVTLPVELNEKELLQLVGKSVQSQWITYGHQLLMVSAQCVQKTMNCCGQDMGDLSLVDRYQKRFLIRRICKYCYNLIYNGLPTVLFDMENQVLKKKTIKRLHFTIEDGEQTKRVLEAYFEHTKVCEEKTRGHYKRGVE